jgi:hypothetical protein
VEKAIIIGVDLAKHMSQVHGACADGSVAFCKKLSRGKLLAFLSSQPRCICPSAGDGLQAADIAREALRGGNRGRCSIRTSKGVGRGRGQAVTPASAARAR